MTIKSHNTKKHSVYHFEPIQLYSNDFSQSFEDESVCFDIINIKDDINGKIKEVTIGSAEIELLPIIDLQPNSLLQLKILDKEEVLVGKLNFGH